jgi:hypothetical protein
VPYDLKCRGDSFVNGEGGKKEDYERKNGWSGIRMLDICCALSRRKYSVV